MEIALHPHPTSPGAAVDSVSVRLERPSVTGIRLLYTVCGRIAEIALPPPAAPARADNLWHTTCFEAFLRPSQGACYLEFNFSPSGRWAAYDFTGYRAGLVPLALAVPPAIAIARTSERLEVDVRLSLDRGPGAHAMALAAVIEEKGGRKSFWAASHAGDAPDFHDPSCFVVELPPPAQA